MSSPLPTASPLATCSAAGAVAPGAAPRPAPLGAVAWLLVYVVAAVVVTWPLARDLGSRLADTTSACAYDLRLIAWALSWQTHALVTDPARFLDANVYHPTPDALLYSEPAYGVLPFFLPLMLSTGNPVLSINVVYLGSIALFAWGLHRVVERATRSAAAGCVAAATVLTSPWLLRLWAPAAPNYAVLFWFPLLIVLGSSPSVGRGRAAVIAIAAILQSIVSPYIAASVLGALATLAAWRCLRRPRERSSWRLAAAVLAAAAVVVCVYVPNLFLRGAEPKLSDQSLWVAARPGPVALLDLLLEFRAYGPAAVPGPLVLLAGAGLLAGAWHGRRDARDEHVLWRHAVLWSAVGLCLAAGRGLRVGSWTLPMPLTPLFALLPGLDLLRVPIRLGVALLPGIAILAGLAFADLTRRIAGTLGGIALHRVRTVAAALVIVACCFAGAAPWFWPTDAGWAASLRQVARLGRWQRPLPAFATTAALPRDSDVRRRLRSIDGPLLVIDLRAKGPLADGRSAVMEMFASIGAWYPLINGYGGYFPAAYPKRMDLARTLPLRRATLRELRADTGVAWVLVRGAPRDPRMGPWLELVDNPNGKLLRFVAGTFAEMLFEVSPDVDRLPDRRTAGRDGDRNERSTLALALPPDP